MASSQINYKFIPQNVNIEWYMQMSRSINVIKLWFETKSKNLGKICTYSSRDISDLIDEDDLFFQCVKSVKWQLITGFFAKRRGVNHLESI